MAPKLQRFGFHIAQREKMLWGKKFDLWFHRRYVGFVIVESEMVGWHDYYNLTKLEEIGILDWKWKSRRPQVVMFQVFSPTYLKGKPRLDEKAYCLDYARKLRKSHRNFRYFPLDMKINPKRFERMVEYFQNSKYAAKQYYSKDIRKELKRLSRIISSRVAEFFEQPED